MVILSMQKTIIMVAMGISGLKSIPRLMIFPESGHW